MDAKFDMLLYIPNTLVRFDPVEGLLLTPSNDNLPLTAIINAFPIAELNGKTLYHCRIDNPSLSDLAQAINATDFESWEAVEELGIRDIYAGRTIEEAKLIFPELAGTRTIVSDGAQIEEPIIRPNTIL